MDRRRILESIRDQGPHRFVTTHWTAVLNATGDACETEAAQTALGELCETYWYPLYAFARRSGRSSEDAKDLTQGFFARVLNSDWLSGLEPAKGRFRSWLLASFKHHLQDAAAHARAQKRGAGLVPISLDALEGEQRYAMEPREPATPERLYDRKWALQVLKAAKDRLSAEYQRAGKLELYQALEPALPGGAGLDSYAEIASLLGMAVNALKVAVHRLRTRFRSALREEIAQTVGAEKEIDDEIRELIEALR